MVDEVKATKKLATNKIDSAQNIIPPSKLSIMQMDDDPTRTPQNRHGRQNKI